MAGSSFRLRNESGEPSDARAQRTSEIGVRMALGATPGKVVSMVLGRVAVLMAAGLAAGGAGAWYLSRGVKTFLFQVEKNGDSHLISRKIVPICEGLPENDVTVPIFSF